MNILTSAFHLAFTIGLSFLLKCVTAASTIQTLKNQVNKSLVLDKPSTI